MKYINALDTTRTDHSNCTSLLNLCHSFNLLNFINEYTGINNREGFDAVDLSYTNVSNATASITKPHMPQITDPKLSTSSKLDMDRTKYRFC